VLCEVLTEETANFGQKALRNKIDLRNLKLLEDLTAEECVVREMAQLASLGLPQAGAWLLTTPIAALSNQQYDFKLAVKYWLGLPVYDRADPCLACLQPSDRFRDHALWCGFWGERITRHNYLWDASYDNPASAALGLSGRDAFCCQARTAAPADVYIPSWSRCLDCALDMTVINPLQQQTIAGAATMLGHALTVAYERQIAGAAAACR
jgi:hypothetical protein